MTNKEMKDNFKKILSGLIWHKIYLEKKSCNKNIIPNPYLVQNFECICSNSKMYIFVLQRIELQKAVLSELHRIVLILTAMCCTELDCTEVTNALLCNTVQVGCSVELDAV